MKCKTTLEEAARREVAGVVRAFLEALDQGGEPPCGVEDNLPTLATACAVLDSSRTDHRIDIAAMLRKADLITRAGEDANTRRHNH